MPLQLTTLFCYPCSNRYFIQVFLAQVILASPQHVPTGDLQQRILHFMESFLSTATYQSIRDWESNHYHCWSLLLPYIKLVYFPESGQERSDIMKRLHMLSLQTALLSLQSKVVRDVHREVLFQEALEDYITCMPSYLPPGPLSDQAKELVVLVGIHRLQPPKLINLAKAKLAKLHFGLAQVVTMNIGEIVNEIMPKL